MEKTPYHHERSVAVAAVREAARLCQAVQAGISPDVIQKKDRSPVTVADYGSQALVCRMLAEAFPEDPVIAEEDAAALRRPENAATLEKVVGHVRAFHPAAGPEDVLAWIDHGGAQEHSARFWTLDPIDGTKGFLRGEQYAIALALIVEGEVTVAALACPNLPVEPGAAERGVVYAAIRGQGAVRVPLAGPGAMVPVHVSTLEDVTKARFCESVESGHSSHDDAARVAEVLGITAEPVRLDSQAKYAVVARGEADIYMRLPTRPGYVEKIWDHAAGMLVVTEAGGMATDVFGAPLDFSRGYRLEKNTGVIISNGRFHDRIIAALEAVGVGRTAG
ncbi:MAG: 3'(2'),5'-bisphosphate nucleotidase [Rhodothermaceae bacterium]|nr:MAG: 3'(2'),5'-bisphosphate nucleotidase [Rhodothermaceae bacterium]